MSSASRFHGLLGNRKALLLILVLACLSTLHCDDSDEAIINSSGPFSLQFRLEAAFQEPHGGQAIQWALLRTDNGVPVATGEGTVSATANPAFTLVTGDVMEFGVQHQIHYWIDSNIDGGTSGVCDAETIDYQTITPFAGPTEDINFIVLYRPELVQYVCDTFAP